MVTSEKEDKSIASDARKTKKLNFDFIKVSFERVAELVPDWGKTPTGVLQNLVAFAIEAIDYARDRNLRAFVPGKGNLFESLDYYHDLGVELIESAYAMNLPEPCSGRLPAWIMDIAHASLQDKHFENPLSRSDYKVLLEKIIAGNALFEYCSQRSIDVDFRPNNVRTWLGDVMSQGSSVTSNRKESNDEYVAIGKAFVKHCQLNGIALPHAKDISNWFERNINNPNQSDCHDMLEMLFAMETLPEEGTMSLLASRYKVMTKQLYKAYYLMHPDDDDAVLHNSTGNNENVDSADG